MLMHNKAIHKLTPADYTVIKEERALLKSTYMTYVLLVLAVT